ncbi:uncharacterized protein BT62DRAFT_930692 [Guyanagaster necrorhizus]|uniref:Uncharacterized protein n=1 Tax=Guyanagaster necrorhizus TaxID=856835 RepID=A0A9P8ATX2_9AGAR|nr:uncharacterized protein BT62DRAFT_930692 [Guyanagaster necrorhizus MCA 3950]KAG7447665.1 hypothetical protein BT62DRAFT_930692 [Guyanagaster necrorhizus MCA 3950]
MARCIYVEFECANVEPLLFYYTPTSSLRDLVRSFSLHFSVSFDYLETGYRIYWVRHPARKSSNLLSFLFWHFLYLERYAPQGVRQLIQEDLVFFKLFHTLLRSLSVQWLVHIASWIRFPQRLITSSYQR